MKVEIYEKLLKNDILYAEVELTPIAENLYECKGEKFTFSERFLYMIDEAGHKKKIGKLKGKKEKITLSGKKNKVLINPVVDVENRYR